MFEEYANYKTDRDVPDVEWNNALKPFKDQYRLELKGDGIWAIKCKYGTIEPCSLIKRDLMFYGNFVGVGRKNNFLKRLPEFAFVLQDATSEAVVRFPVDRLKDMEELCLVKMRRKMSEEQKEAARERIKTHISEGKWKLFKKKGDIA